MSDLATMKARIASELRRSDLTSQIATAISSSIGALEDQRFFFTETRNISFNTVALQEFYDGDDNANIPLIQKFDYVVVEIGSSYYPVLPRPAKEIEILNGDGDFTGQPIYYVYYNQQIRLYPIPSEAYPIRIGAQVKVAAPASDSETNNPWMLVAERAVRCRAKYEIYEHVLLDREMADRFNPENALGPTYEAISQLRARTNRLLQQGGWEVVPTQF